MRVIACLMALLMGCGAAPETSIPVQMPGAPAELAAWLVLRPATFDRALTALDERTGDTAALGPVGVAWRTARAMIEDQLGHWAPAGSTAADGWSAWGLSRSQPVYVGLASPGGVALARDLVARLDGAPATPTAAAAWHLRIVLGVDDATRLRAGLDDAAGRMGLRVDPPGVAAWRAALPEADMTFALTLRGPYGIVDIARRVGAGQGDPIAEIPWPPVPAAPLAFGVRPATMAALDAGLAVSQTFSRTADVEPGRARVVLKATADLVVDCLTRWRSAAAIVESTTVAIDAPDGRPDVRAEVQLTVKGRRRWSASRLPPILERLDGLPAAFQLALFPGGMSADLARWPDEISGCPAGHPGFILPIAAGLLPALSRPELMPMPAPTNGWPRQPLGLAGALVGAHRAADTMVPTLAGVVRVTARHRLGPAPLGPDAAAPVDGVHVAAGPVPVTLGLHRAGTEQVMILGLGPGAHGAMLDRLGAGDAPPGLVLDARLDPSALASAFGEAGETVGVDALAAIGERFGRWRLTAELAGDRVRWTVSAKAPELDRPPPPQ